MTSKTFSESELDFERLVSLAGIDKARAPAAKTHSARMQLVIVAAALQPDISACRLRMNLVPFQTVQ